MKPKKVWQVYPAILASLILSILLLAVLCFWDIRIFAVALIITGAVFSVVFWRFLRLKNDIRGYLADVAIHLDQQDRVALESTPMPVILFSETGEIVWYNDRFRETVLGDNDVYGGNFETVSPNVPLKRLQSGKSSK